MAGDPTIRRLYEEALDSFLEKVKQDPYILAVILLGSLSHDVVWKKSDIDLFLVTEEESRKPTAGKHAGGKPSEFCLVERGINIHAYPTTRSEFKRRMEGALQSSFLHSTLNKGRLVFTRDETLRALFEQGGRVGRRDREIGLLQAGASVLPALAKAEKWLWVKEDPTYSFFWLMRCVDGLAAIETLLQGEVTGREVIHQALRHNPGFFNRIYTDLIHGPKTQETLPTALRLVEEYLQERIPLLFKPILDHLAESGGVRSTSEMNHYFLNQMNLSNLESAYEWLADQEIILKVSSPVRLTPKSRVDVDEAAYYYEGDLR